MPQLKGFVFSSIPLAQVKLNIIVLRLRKRKGINQSCANTLSELGPFFNVSVMRQALDFQPVAGSLAAQVRRIFSFGNDAFEVFTAGFLEEGCAVGVNITAQHDAVGFFDNFVQDFFALHKRAAREVFAV